MPFDYREVLQEDCLSSEGESGGRRRSEETESSMFGGDERPHRLANTEAADSLSTDGSCDAMKKVTKHPPSPPLPVSDVAEPTRPVDGGFQCPSIPFMVILLLMFAALSQSFSSTCISIFVNSELGYGPVQVTLYWAYVSFTAWFQPLIGAVSDMLVIQQEKRRPLFIICAVGNTIMYSIFQFSSAATSNYGVFVACSIVANIFTMGIYIPLNGILVEVGRSDSESQAESVARVSAIMSKAMVYRSVGSLGGTIIHTCLVAKLSVHTMLGVSAVLFTILVPLVLSAPRSLFLRDSASQENFYTRSKEACEGIARSFKLGDLRSDGFCFVLVLLFVFLYTVLPDAGSVYYNYLYGAFAFPNWFYSLNACIGYLGSIVGAYIFSLWMDYRARIEYHHRGARTSMFFIFAIGCVAWAVGYVTNLLLCTGFVEDVLHIPAAAYIPVDNFFTSLFVRFAFMPTIAMAAEHAPKHFEATAFEVFSVASMAGGTVSSLLTSLIASGLNITRDNYSALWILLLISIICKLAPIPLAYLLPEKRHEGLPDPVVVVVAPGNDEDGSVHNAPSAGIRSASEHSPRRAEQEVPDAAAEGVEVSGPQITESTRRHRTTLHESMGSLEYPNAVRQ